MPDRFSAFMHKLTPFAIAATCVLTALDIAIEAIGNADYLIGFKGSSPMQSFWQYASQLGVLLCSLAFALWPRLFGKVPRRSFIVGVAIFLLANTSAAIAQQAGLSSDATTTVLFVFMGIGYIMAKFVVLALVIRRESIGALIAILTAYQIAKTLLIPILITVSALSQLVVTLIFMLASSIWFAFVFTGRSGGGAADVEPRHAKADESGNVVGQCVFASIGYASIQVLARSRAEGGFYSLETFSYAAVVICLLVAVYFLLVHNQPEQPNLRLPFVLILSGFFIVCMQSVTTWTLSDEVTRIALVVLERFGHILYWVAVASLCQVTGRNTYRVFGVAMAIYSLCAVVWLLIVGYAGDAVIPFILLFTYVSVFAIVKVTAVAQTSRDKTLVDDAYLQALADDRDLSEREAQVFMLLAQGRSRKYIGDALGLSDGSVKNYSTSIYRKFEVSGKQELLQKILDTK